jgi:hypothetical protein
MATTAPVEAPEAPPQQQQDTRPKGERIHAAVKKLMSGKKPITVTDAFNRVAEAEDMQPGTVSAHYYRIERKNRGESPAPRVQRVRQARTSGRDVDAILAAMEQNLRDLRAAVREDAGKLDRLRSLLS